MKQKKNTQFEPFEFTLNNPTELEPGSYMVTEAGNYEILEVIERTKEYTKFKIVEISKKRSKELEISHVDNSIRLENYDGKSYWSNGYKFIDLGNGKFLPTFAKSKFTA